MVREFKDEGATVRVFGKVNEDAVKKATVLFLTEVEKEKTKKENRKNGT
jgi:hypothetical protein